jgi:hypothetical protein
MSFKTIGADVEVFAKDREGKHKSLCGLIGGTKDEPKQIKGLEKGFCVQEDNVSLEFNIPSTTREGLFQLYIQTMVDQSKKLLDKLDMSISKECGVSFDKSELLHPNALVFGCEPDYDAWKRIENKKPISKDETLRTAGGHVHVGTRLNMLELIKNMDLRLGVPSILLDDNSASARRRELYGKAGAMRPKPYGAEYRVLSNFWIFDEALIRWVFTQTQSACILPKKFTKKEEADIVNCINNSDRSLARSLIDKYKVYMPC